MDLAQRLIDRWHAHGIDCPPGVSPAQIADFEARYSVRMPADLRSYFLLVNGMGQRGNADEDFYSFWPLSEVKSVAEEFPGSPEAISNAANYFLIADHSVFVPAFAIRLVGNDIYHNPIATVYSASDFADAFGSFSDFVEYYLRDPLGATIASPLDA